MFVYSNAGLCNRLRVMFSYNIIANKNNEKLDMIWDNNKACPGYFLDYFEPVKNINLLNKFTENTSIIKTNSQHKLTKNIFVYDHLNLKLSLQTKIQNYIKQLGSYVAVHIRRTDTISCPKKKNLYLSNETYINFINKYKDYNVYIATDNYETQNEFYQLFKDRIKIINYISKPQKYIPSIRQTSLEETIIDMYMCINSNYFLGSDYSSLTTFVKEMRNNNKLL
jgi:hypothetical protein